MKVKKAMALIMTILSLSILAGCGDKEAIPLEDLIRQYAPNLMGLLDGRNGWQYITASDGHAYSIPQVGRMGASNPYYWINKRWMDNRARISSRNKVRYGDMHQTRMDLQ